MIGLPGLSICDINELVRFFMGKVLRIIYNKISIYVVFSLGSNDNRINK